jgi:GT2 family glycosyltransferase
MNDVTVITSAIETRLFDHLPAALQSVKTQSLQPKSHIISVDYDRVGTSANANRAVQSVDTEFFLCMADDDFLYPTCLERLMANSEGADLIYPWCKVVGRGAWNPNSHFDPNRLKRAPYIPATVLHRTSKFWEVGGFTEGIVCEDHDYQLKLLNAGGVFRCVPEILWEYRFHGQNISDGNDPKLI